MEVHMTIARSHLVGGAALVAALALAACGGSPAPAASGASAPPANTATTLPAPQNAPTTQPAAAISPTTAASTAPTVAPNPVPTAAAAVDGEGNGEEGGVEAALVTYADAAQHFSICHPGPSTQDPAIKVGVQINCGDDRMLFEVLQ